ncbi:MAG: SurA N-terminal domain-containing protein [Rickettsiales bacterium]|nr:SurA N-terminal domain-containing protein [Rickettsiales bacterium]
MLTTIRTHAKGFAAKLLLTLLVVSFAIWGIGDMVRTDHSNATVADVGNKSISAHAYAGALHREMENVRRALGERFSPELVKSLRIGDQVLQRLIQQKLWEMESKALGILPSDADVVRKIRSNPSFHDSKGMFDKSQFENALRNARMLEKDYVEQVRTELATKLFNDMLSTPIPMTDNVIENLYKAREQKRTATLYIMDTSAVDSSKITIDDAQIEAYYRQNQSLFSVPEYRTISYISFKHDDIPAKVNVSQEEIESAYRERIEEFKHPEQRVVEQLLFKEKPQADKAMAALKAGKRFEEVASSVDVINKNAISLGSVEKNRIMDAAADQVFALSQGDFTQPVQSDFGWHIFHVSKIIPPAATPLSQVRDKIEKELAQHDQDDAAAEYTNRMEDAIAGGATLADVAKEFKFKLQQVGPVSKAGLGLDGKALAALPNLDKFLDVAFKTEEKTESSLTVSKGSTYYILRVESIVPEHAKALKEVKAQVVTNLQKDLRLKKLGELADDLAAKLKTGKAQELLSQYKVKTVQSDPFKRNSLIAGSQPLPAGLSEEVFAHKVGETTGAYLDKDGNYVIASVKSIVPTKLQATSDEQKSDLAEIRRELGTNLENEVVSQYLRYLANKYEVKIHEPVLQAVENNAL